MPKFGESIENVLSILLTEHDLIEINNLYSTVSLLEQKILANDGVNAFDEIFKLIFAKLYDESETRDGQALKFQVIHNQKISLVINQLFEAAKENWKDVFKPKDEIELSEETLIAVVSELQEYKLFEADFEILDAAFEHMISGDKSLLKSKQVFITKPS